MSLVMRNMSSQWFSETWSYFYRLTNNVVASEPTNLWDPQIKSRKRDS